jgi:hypothetical protein
MASTITAWAVLGPHRAWSPCRRKTNRWALASGRSGDPYPGILTGVAAVITAVATLGALFVGRSGDGTEAPTPGAAPTQPTGATAAGAGGCFGEYFKGIPQDRVGSVEAGAQAYDVITETQPKAGTIGMTFTNNARPIGAIRFAFFPANRFFKIESIVDAQCKPIEDYTNLEGGDKHVAGDSSTVPAPPRWPLLRPKRQRWWKRHQDLVRVRGALASMAAVCGLNPASAGLGECRPPGPS